MGVYKNGKWLSWSTSQIPILLLRSFLTNSGESLTQLSQRERHPIFYWTSHQVTVLFLTTQLISAPPQPKALGTDLPKYAIFYQGRFKNELATPHLPKMLNDLIDLASRIKRRIHEGIREWVHPVRPSPIHKLRSWPDLFPRISVLFPRQPKDSWTKAAW